MCQEKRRPTGDVVADSSPAEIVRLGAMVGRLGSVYKDKNEPLPQRYRCFAPHHQAFDRAEPNVKTCLVSLAFAHSTCEEYRLSVCGIISFSLKILR